jgi:hypothetical protein
MDDQEKVRTAHRVPNSGHGAALCHHRRRAAFSKAEAIGRLDGDANLPPPLPFSRNARACVRGIAGRSQQGGGVSRAAAPARRPGVEIFGARQA